jgi:hypothetical protein
MEPNKPESMPRARPLRSAVIALYAALALLWLAIPQSVSNWTREALPVPLQPYATPVAETVEKAARLTGLPAFYEAAREFFVLVTKK